MPIVIKLPKGRIAEMVTRKALALANYFIDKFTKSGEGITHLKLQKLVYITHGLYLYVYKIPLISDEIEAWTYGPVITSLYHQFKHYGERPIDKLGELMDFTNITDIKIKTPILSDNPDYENIKIIADIAIGHYGKLDGLSLSELCHKKGTPWSDTKNKEGLNSPIPNKLIEKHFEDLISKKSAAVNSTS